MVRVEEAQKGKFVDALGAKLAASFASPGPAAPKHERARFTAVARAAIERLPTAALRENLLGDFDAISATLWERYASKHAVAEAPSAGGDRPPCILAAGGVALALASGSTDGASLEKLVQLPWLSESHQPQTAAALQTAIAEGVFGVSEALRLASVASCGEHSDPSPLAVAVLAATQEKLCASKKALPRHVAAARATFQRLAQRPLLAVAGARRDSPKVLRRTCASYLQMCSLHGGPTAIERRHNEPAARCAARHIGLMLGYGHPAVAEDISSTPMEQLSALLYSLYTGSDTRNSSAGSFTRIVMDTLVSLLSLEIPHRWRPTAPPDSYLQLLIVLRLASQPLPPRPPGAGKPSKGRKIARKLCEEVVGTLRPKIEVATIPRAVAVAARAENGGSDPGAELVGWPVDRLRLLLARVEEELGLRSDRAVAGAARASASAEFFMDTGPAAENGQSEGDHGAAEPSDEDEEGERRNRNELEKLESAEEEEEEAEQQQEEQEQQQEEQEQQEEEDHHHQKQQTQEQDKAPAPRRPTRSGKRKVSEQIEKSDLEDAKDRPRKSLRAPRSSSKKGSAKKKPRTRSQRK